MQQADSVHTVSVTDAVTVSRFAGGRPSVNVCKAYHFQYCIRNNYRLHS